MSAPKWVRPTATVIFLLGVAGLTYSGRSISEIGSLLSITGGVITAITGLVAAIIGKNGG